MTSEELRDALFQFYGTEHWYKMIFGPTTYTDGVKFFADSAGAHWFLDIVATEIATLRVPFAYIILTVKGEKADINVTDGNDNYLWRRHIDFTDCPEGEWKFYLTDNVMLLPGEY